MIISEFSKRTGVSPSTLRYYEDKGLIRVRRDAGGRRDYSEQDAEWVKFIKRLKDTGMGLNEIKRKRQIVRHLSPCDRMGKRGTRNERRKGMLKLRKKVHPDLPHHAAEILQRHVPVSL